MALAQEAGSSAPDMGSAALKAMGALLLVLGLILILAWLAKRYLRFLPKNTARGDGIQILAGKSLGPKRSLYLIEVEGHRLLVGSAELGVTLIKDLHTPPKA
jgi:flagellar protein FliO/FliZ